MIEELLAIANEMTALLDQFVEGDSMTGRFLPTEHEATFKRLAIEAQSILDDELGQRNAFGANLVHAINSGSGGFIGGPSYAAVSEAAEILRGAVRTIERRRARPTAAPSDAKAYVAPERIAALQSLRLSAWDFARLAELCREINVAAANRCHMSTAMLLRTILNHVPPVLGFNTFAEVANNYGGTKDHKSFKQTMQRLQGSLRAIADMHLHSPIRQQEDVPTGVQVDFAAELDVLLGEVLRVARGQPE